MSTALLLLLSGVLIGAGVSLIWRDVHRRQRDAFVLYRDPAVGAETRSDVEITVSHRPASVPLESPKQAAVQIARPRPVTGAPVDATAVQDAFPRPDAARPSATAQQWAALQAVINAAVDQVNSVLGGAGVSIGSPGEPSWSMDRAYGVHRRVLVGGESVAWLRLQCTPDGVLNALVKAHKDELAAVNAQASAPASGLSIGLASHLLSECLKPTAAYAGTPGRHA